MGRLLRANSSAATFKAAFAAAEGWGGFEQTITTGALHPVIKIKYGQLRLTTMTLGTPTGATFGMATVPKAGTAVPVQADASVPGQSKIMFLTAVMIPLGEKLDVIPI